MILLKALAKLPVHTKDTYLTYGVETLSDRNSSCVERVRNLSCTILIQLVPTRATHGKSGWTDTRPRSLCK